MAGVNKVILIGNLGQDPEVRMTNSGTPVCELRLACTDRRRTQDGQWEEQTEWVTVVTFGRTAENAGKFLAKGRSVYIEGRMQTRSWDDQDGKKRYKTEVVAQTVQFLGGRGESDSYSSKTPSGGYGGGQQGGGQQGGGYGGGQQGGGYGGGQQGGGYGGGQQGGGYGGGQQGGGYGGGQQGGGYGGGQQSGGQQGGGQQAGGYGGQGDGYSSGYASQAPQPSAAPAPAAPAPVAAPAPQQPNQNSGFSFSGEDGDDSVPF